MSINKQKFEFLFEEMLKVKNLNFWYNDSQQILTDLNFELKKGQILSILGESGSGKSTLLRLIYGLEDATFGELFYGEEKVTGPKFNLVPGHKAMKFVPQEFDLVDSIRVSENVGKYLSNTDLKLKKESVLKALEVVDLQKLKNAYPSQLSGGQRQRVSIARALAAQPEVLLLDEPYSHLDQPLKFKIRKNIWNWARENKCMVILTTHDVNDAFGFSDQLMILKDGKKIQMNSPEIIRQSPVDKYVAGILGIYSEFNSQELQTIFGISIPKNKSLLVYPNEFQIDEEGVEFEIKSSWFQGERYLVECQRNGKSIWFYSQKKPSIKIVYLNVNLPTLRLIEN